MSGNHFDIQVQCDLDLGPSEPKINRGHLLVMTNLQVKYEGSVINGFQDISGNYFIIQGNCDLDFWPSDSKINWGYLLLIMNLHVKYEDFVIYGIQDNQRKPFWHSRWLWPWPSDPQINWGHLLVRTNLHVKYEGFIINGFQDNHWKPYGLLLIQSALCKFLYMTVTHYLNKTLYRVFFGTNIL